MCQSAFPCRWKLYRNSDRKLFLRAGRLKWLSTENDLNKRTMKSEELAACKRQNTNFSSTDEDCDASSTAGETTRVLLSPAFKPCGQLAEEEMIFLKLDLIRFFLAPISLWI